MNVLHVPAPATRHRDVAHVSSANHWKSGVSIQASHTSLPSIKHGIAQQDYWAVRSDPRPNVRVIEFPKPSFSGFRPIPHYFVFHIAGVLIHVLLVFALISFMIYVFIGKRGVE